ncbi:hypothetical protein L218DRAFT_835251, partial [Marasmius fiardii PR-910]
IEIHTLEDDVCQVWGRHLKPRSEGLMSSKRKFTSSNGQEYTWKQKTSGKKTLLWDKFQNTVAVYEDKHSGIFSGKPSPAKLSISPAGYPIVDEILVTFLFVKQKE